MASRLYVGNLPYQSTETELRQLFGEAGTVESVTMPTDRETGRPRGFAFVQMADDEEANRGIRMFDGYMLDGRRLRVNIAQERESRGGGYFRAG
ncbi:MAG TPA: RNA-binding protein [Chloroflexota bacterium]|nr:RNA-binding protein [Chloroflexota bacterium]